MGTRRKHGNKKKGKRAQAQENRRAFTCQNVYIVIVLSSWSWKGNKQDEMYYYKGGFGIDGI